MKTSTHTPVAPPAPALAGFLMRSVEGRWHRVAAELERNRLRCTEPGVHDLRVAVRRLLAVMDLAAAVLPGEAGTRARRVLRRTLKSFSPLRDCHVRILALRGLVRRFTVARPLLRESRTLEKELLKNAGRLIARFDASALEREVSAIAVALASLEDTPERVSAASAVLAGVAAKKYLRVAARGRRVSPADTRTIHRLRVAFKEFRYTIEVLLPVVGGGGKARLKSMREFQDSMGEIQDVEVLIAAVGKFAVTKGSAYPASVQNLQRHLALRRFALINAFMDGADALGRFWPHQGRIR